MNCVLELLNPAGFAGTIRVAGSAAGRLGVTNQCDGPVDLLVLAPTPDEAARPAWISAQVQPDSLARSGVVYLLAPTRDQGTISDVLRASELYASGSFIHLVRSDPPRHGPAPDPQAEGFACRALHGMTGVKGSSPGRLACAGGVDGGGSRGFQRRGGVPTEGRTATDGLGHGRSPRAYILRSLVRKPRPEPDRIGLPRLEWSGRRGPEALPSCRRWRGRASSASTIGRECQPGGPCRPAGDRNCHDRGGNVHADIDSARASSRARAGWTTGTPPRDPRRDRRLA